MTFRSPARRARLWCTLTLCSLGLVACGESDTRDGGTADTGVGVDGGSPDANGLTDAAPAIDATPPDAHADAADARNGAITGPRDHTVFATSTVHSGDLGGPQGADGICAARASDAGLPGTFVAWLSTSAASATDRLDVEDDARFVRVDGVVVAEGKADLLDGTLTAAIAADEQGRAVRGDVWTGSLADGTLEADRHCLGFTSASSGVLGLCGSTAATDTRWSAVQVPSCSTQLRLYCFEL